MYTVLGACDFQSRVDCTVRAVLQVENLHLQLVIQVLMQTSQDSAWNGVIAEEHTYGKDGTLPEDLQM